MVCQASSRHIKREAYPSLAAALYSIFPYFTMFKSAHWSDESFVPMPQFKLSSYSELQGALGAPVRTCAAITTIVNALLTSEQVEAVATPKEPESKTPTAYTVESPEPSMSLYAVGVYDTDMTAATAANSGESMTPPAHIDH